MQANFEHSFSTFLPMLRDGKHKDQHEAIKANLLQGCSIIPLSSTVRGEIADVFNMDPAQISELDDQAVIRLAFNGLDDPRTIQALLFHAGILSALFTTMDQRN